MIGITSFSQSGYETYGKQFLSTIDNWPGKIICYLESPIDFEHEKLEKRNLFDVEHITAFLTYLKNFPKAHGKTDKGYNYNFDVWKFCRKMFAQFDAFKEGGKMYWLDADCIITKPVPLDFLEDLFHGEPLVFLGREGFYTETGIVGFDTDHIEFEDFILNYKETLQKGVVFKLKQWHDCACFDYAREGNGQNLTDWWDIAKALKGGLEYLEVLSKSPLGEYFIHKKGNKKREGLQ